MSARVTIAGSSAVVTGSGDGIGRATALALAARSATVVVTDIDPDKAAATVAMITNAGGRASAHTLDVRDADAVALLAREVSADIVVANAGVGMSGRLTDMTVDDWRWIREVNLDGVIHTLMAFGPGMLERGRGQAVVMSSGLGYTMRATEPAYVTTKAAVLALARSVRADWRAQGVGVTAVCPGVINTHIIEATRFAGDDGTQRANAQKLFRRGHSPDTVAKAVVRGIESDRSIVTAGWEAKLGWFINRAMPVGIQQVMARGGLPG